MENKELNDFLIKIYQEVVDNKNINNLLQEKVLEAINSFKSELEKNSDDIIEVENKLKDFEKKINEIIKEQNLKLDEQNKKIIDIEKNFISVEKDTENNTERGKQTQDLLIKVAMFVIGGFISAIFFILRK